MLWINYNGKGFNRNRTRQVIRFIFQNISKALRPSVSPSGIPPESFSIIIATFHQYLPLRPYSEGFPLRFTYSNVNKFIFFTINTFYLKITMWLNLFKKIRMEKKLNKLIFNWTFLQILKKNYAICFWPNTKFIYSTINQK